MGRHSQKDGARVEQKWNGRQLANKPATRLVWAWARWFNRPFSGQTQHKVHVVLEQIIASHVVWPGSGFGAHFVLYSVVLDKLDRWLK